MRRRYFTLLALCVSLMVWANPVDVETASGIAQKFILQKVKEIDAACGVRRALVDAQVDMKLVYESAETTGNTSSEYYVFAPMDAEGFVIVAGEDKVEPIVGYSLTSNFSTERMSPALENLLLSYAQYVDAVRAGEVEVVTQRESTVTPIFPFITTAWNQSYPYNYYCPEINGQRAVTGCVATATAQIMNYYEWPKAGHGSCVAGLNDGFDTSVTLTLGEQYDWANMKDIYSSSYSEVEAQAVGLLMRDVGYACSLYYGVDATSGYTTGALMALLDYFDYSPNIRIIDKNYYSDAAWKETLYKELSAGRPVYYAGQSGGGGHAFVCCGMDQYGGYYINWGWGGFNDGYFYLDDLGGFSYDQNAIIGIKPISSGENRFQYVAIPHVGMVEIQTQTTSLSAPSVTCYIRVNNMTAENVSGRMGFALFENGTMVSEVKRLESDYYLENLPPNYWAGRPATMNLTGVAGLSQGVREIRFFWQVEGSNEWIDPLGDHCVYMKTTANGHSFSTVLAEEETPEIPIAEIEDGLYYLKHVATGKYLTAANDWGTRASLGEHGLDVKISRQSNGNYTIDTQIYGEDASKCYLGMADGFLYMDASKAEWTIGVLENGHYVLTKDNASTFMGNRADVLFNNVTNPEEDDAVQWQLLSKKDLMASLDNASADNPVDATFLIQGANFGRNDSRNSYWKGTPSINGSVNNYCAEKWNTGTFDVNQVVTGLPNGLYELRVQGFYREGGVDNTPNVAAANYAAGKSVQNTKLYANKVSIPLASIMDEAKKGSIPNEHFYLTSLGYVPQDLMGASTFFTEGLYQHRLQVKVSDGTLRVGVKKDVASAFDWTCFDNFELYYYGATTYEEEKYEVVFILDGEVVKRDSLVAGATITPPDAPAKEGYTFVGWGDIPATMPDKDITIEGEYVANTYTLVYKVDGEIYKTYSIEYNATVIVEPEPEKEGYTFSGWSEIPEIMPAEDVEVNGSFVINEYEVVFILDGEVVKNESLVYGATITPPDAPVKEGYTFVGWGDIPASMPAENLTFTGTYVINKYAVVYKVDGEVYLTDSVEYNAPITAKPAPIKEGYTFSGWSEIPEIMPANNITVIGTFVINKYLITFIIDDEVIASDSLEYGSAIVTPEGPEKEGHTFNGWGEVAETMPAHDLTYQGGYTANTYKVYYYVGEELVHTDEVVYGNRIPEYIYKPTEEGYTFVGWVGETYETMPAHDVVYIANIDDSIDQLLNDNLQLTIYDITGRKVTATKALKGGIYIINGRKVMIGGMRE